MTYLNLSTDIVPSNMRLRARRPQTKNFTRLIAQNKKAFFVLHNLAFQMLFKVWCKLVSENTNVNLPPNFNLAITDTLIRVDRLLSETQYQTELIMKWSFLSAIGLI